MKYITLIYEHEDEITRSSPEKVQILIKQHNQLQAEAKQSQAYLAAAELKSADKALSLRTQNKQHGITDGPFTESKEIFVGFYLFECQDLNSVVRWAKMIPTRPQGGIEIRPLDGDECPNTTRIDWHRSDKNQSQLFVLLVYQLAEVVDQYSSQDLEHLIHSNQKMADQAQTKGHYVVGHKLMPPVTASSIKNNTTKQIITDGPFSEAKEVLIGFHILNTQLIDQAMEYAKQLPNTGVIEIRPIQFYEQIQYDQPEESFQWNSLNSL